LYQNAIYSKYKPNIALGCQSYRVSC
jgi:hypothetical protein